MHYVWAKYLVFSGICFILTYICASYEVQFLAKKPKPTYFNQNRLISCDILIMPATTQKSPSVPQIPTKKEKHVSNVLDGLHQALFQGLSQVKDSKSFFNVGISDELAQYIGQYYDQPLTILSHGLDSHFESVRNILESTLQKEVFSNSSVLQKVYRTNNEGNLLHYCLVLKQDTLKNRRPFLHFLNEYSKQKISNQFPIFFDFVSSKREPSINKVKEIPFNAGTSSASKA